MRIELPFPDKVLWPNGGTRTHYGKLSRLKANHKRDAYFAAMEKGGSIPFDGEELVPVRLIVHAKPKGPLPDRDNCVAALKSYQDGIAQCLGIDDKHFREPVVSFATPRDGRFVIELGK